MGQQCTRRKWLACLLVPLAAIVGGPLVTGAAEDGKSGHFSKGRRRPDAHAVARRVDDAIGQDLGRRGVEPSPRVDDAQFLRRASFDITGTPPTADEVTLFVLDPDPDKRDKAVRRMLASERFARNWARYWRDAILYRAQDRRAQQVRGSLESWLTDQFAADRGWDEITTSLLSATGDIRENGNTALVVAQMAQASELAAETSRLFLGIQIQCAQCHDHPYDDWKREQFHQLAAYFPRVRVRRQPDKKGFDVVSQDKARRSLLLADPEKVLARLDANDDGRIARGEAPVRLQRLFDRLVKVGDRDNDESLSRDELQAIPPLPAGRNRTVEHYMPDLDHPDQPGTLTHPAFFVSGQSTNEGLRDLERRRALADILTAPDNPWFARAYVNRVWAEMMGQGFTEPVDDMGPGHDTAFPSVLDLLADGFRQSGYRTKWLVWTIALTEAYQRRVRPRGPSGDGSRFAAVCPTRLTADQLLDALARALGLDFDAASRSEDGASKRRRRARNVRAQFARLFGYDPSTPADEVSGTIPQALFLMNSPLLASRLSARGNTPLARLLDQTNDDRAVVAELYLLTLSREPSEKELQACLAYLADADNRRGAFEDILWCLVNSTEFLTNR